MKIKKNENEYYEETCDIDCATGVEKKCGFICLKCTHIKA